MNANLNSLDSISEPSNDVNSVASFGNKFSSIVKKKEPEGVVNKSTNDLLFRQSFSSTSRPILVATLQNRFATRPAVNVMRSQQQPIHINDCLITPERDLEFKIDYNGSGSSLVKHRYTSDGGTGSLANMAFYQIEITVPDDGSIIDKNKTAAFQKPTVRMTKTLNAKKLTFNLTLRKENNNSQVSLEASFLCWH